MELNVIWGASCGFGVLFKYTVAMKFQAADAPDFSDVWVNLRPKMRSFDKGICV
jgi:hypothetical protein